MEPRILRHDVKGEGEPIVLVPGGLTGWLSWIPHQERLSGRYRAIRGPADPQRARIGRSSRGPRVHS
jgi:hypothetical protein